MKELIKKLDTKHTKFIESMIEIGKNASRNQCHPSFYEDKEEYEKYVNDLILYFKSNIKNQLSRLEAIEALSKIVFNKNNNEPNNQ